MKRKRKWLRRTVLSWCFLGPALAVSAPDNEYNFDWLDPDKKVYVLQNRKFRKSGRFLVSAMAGLGTSNPYRNVLNFEPRLAFYLSDLFGLEAFYTASTNNPNGTFKALSGASPNAIPVVREIRSQVGGLVHWSPWYAKINVFNTILHFDWYFSGGAGQMSTALSTNTTASQPATYALENLTAFYLGTGHQYHLNQSFIVRLDFMGAIYRAPEFGSSGPGSWFVNYNFNVGAGFRF